MQFLRYLPLALLPLFMPVMAWCAPQPVLPGQVFNGEVLNIRAPSSEGWFLDQSSPGGWSFGRNGTTANERYVASVVAFALTETTGPDDFVALIRRGIEGDTSPTRFTVLDSNYEYTDARGYPCVKYQSTAEDRKARISLLKTEVQKLQMSALYCRHPKRQDLGFAVTFSHRGSGLDPDLEKQAQEFIGGVEVPPPAGEPAPGP